MLTRLIYRCETRFRTSERSGVARLGHIGKGIDEVGEVLPVALTKEKSRFVTGGSVNV